MPNPLAKALRCVGILVCFAANAFSQSPTTFQLTGVQGATLPVGAVYTSPYYATIGSTTNVAVICDDFADDTYFNESWLAYVTDLSSINSTTNQLMWASGGLSGSIGSTLGEDTAYTVAAYLAMEIMTTAQGSGDQQVLSYAMWGLFDPSAFTYLSNNGLGNDVTQAQNDITYAYTQVKDDGLNFSNFAAKTGDTITIYSYDTGATCSGSPCPTATPQEFIKVSMAEPAYPAMLAVDLLAVVGLVVGFRRRMPMLRS